MIVEPARAEDREERLVGERIAVATHWSGDRWALGVDAVGRQPLLETAPSPEPDNDLRMGNPAFQQCLRRTTDAGGELLLVGQCGRRHFSAVVALAEDRVTIDVADRWTVPLPIEHWKLTLRTGPATELLGCDETGCTLAVPGELPSTWRVTSLARHSSEGRPLLLTFEPESRALRWCAAAEGVAAPRTLCYGLQIEPA